MLIRCSECNTLNGPEHVYQRHTEIQKEYTTGKERGFFFSILKLLGA